MTNINAHPIVFSAPMVRAIQAGLKTVTRHVVKATKAHADGFMMLDHGAGWWPYNAFGDFSSDSEGMEYPIACPYGKPGDRLWVRETFIDLRGTGVEHRPDPDGPLQRYAYAADYRPGSHSDEARKDFGLKHKPSIHMPRAASRILLEVTAVRVERLQDISESQAMAEGIVDVAFRPDDGWPICTGYMVGPNDGKTTLETTAVGAFRRFWKEVGGNWEANPWVWVIEFKRVVEGAQ